MLEKTLAYPTSIADPCLTTADAATYLGYAPQTLTNWRATGKGPRYLRSGRPGSRVTYRLSDLNSWADQHLVGGGAR